MTNETMDLLEARISEDLKLLETETDEKKRALIVREVDRLATKLSEAETLYLKATTDESARELDRSKVYSQAETERTKARWDMISRTMAAIVTAGIPAIISVLTLKVWKNGYREMMKFEETGRLVSSASKEFHLPRIF